MGMIIALIALFFGILSLPGNREDEIMIDKYYSPDSVERMNFFKVFEMMVSLSDLLEGIIIDYLNGERDG